MGPLTKEELKQIANANDYQKLADYLFHLMEAGTLDSLALKELEQGFKLHYEESKAVYNEYLTALQEKQPELAKKISAHHENYRYLPIAYKFCSHLSSHEIPFLYLPTILQKITELTEAEKDTLNTLAQKVFRLNSFQYLLQRYSAAISLIEQPEELSHYFKFLNVLMLDPMLTYQYQPISGPTTSLFRPDIQWENLFPACMDEKFLTAFRAAMQQTTMYEHIAKPFFSFLLFKMIKQTYPQFADWRMLPKTAGKELGFIMQSPRGDQRWFVKKTQNAVPEFFVSLCLTSMGIKYPETQLLLPNEDKLLATLDMTRKYTKGSIEKRKHFRTLWQLTKDKKYSHIVDTTGIKPSNEEIHEVEKLIEELLGPPASTDPLHVKARISLAKILVCRQIFGLGDLGNHHSNVGIIETESYNKKHELKFGLVDFSSYPSMLKMNKNFIDLIKEQGGATTTFLFQKMIERIMDEDLIAAFELLTVPKARSAVGTLMLTDANNNASIALETILEKTYVQLIDEFKTSPQSQAEIKNYFEKIEKNIKDLKMLSNDFIAKKENKQRPSL